MLDKETVLLASGGGAPEAGYEKYLLTIGYAFHERPSGVTRPDYYVWGYSKNECGDLQPNSVAGKEITDLNVQRTTGGKHALECGFGNTGWTFYYDGVKYIDNESDNTKLSELVSKWEGLVGSTVVIWIKGGASF